MLIALTISLILLTYLPTLSYDLVIDDIEWYNRVHGHQQILLRHPRTILYAFTAFPTKIEHLITLLLHITTCLLLYHITPIASLLYCVHPCNHMTSVWLTGRRYSYINILILSLWIISPYLIFPSILLIAIAYSKRLHARKHLPYPPYTTTSILNLIRHSLIKLTGIPKYAFCYNYPNTASIPPCSQPAAERYLSLPLILLCIAASIIPFIYVILPLYAFRTIQLMPMYASIQSFYNYHRTISSKEKLSLLKKLYPQIV